MGKARIYAKQKDSLASTSSKSRVSASTSKKEVRLKKGAKVRRYKPYQALADEGFVAQAIWDCLRNNEPEEIVDIIKGHLLAVNKLQACKEGDLARSTLYHALKGKNPTLKTLAKVISSCI